MESKPLTDRLDQMTGTNGSLIPSLRPNLLQTLQSNPMARSLCNNILVRASGETSKYDSFKKQHCYSIYVIGIKSLTTLFSSFKKTGLPPLSHLSRKHAYFHYLLQY